MPLFKANFQRPGPGVPKDAPPKKGLARYFEILGRDFFDIWKVSGLTALSFAPAAVVFAVVWAWRSYPGALVLGLLAGLVAAVPAGPALCAGHAVLSRAVWDEPYFFWHEYKKAWKSCAKQAIPLGMVEGALLGATCIAVGLVFTSSAPNMGLLAVLLFGLLVQTGLWLLVTLQMAYLNVPTLGLVHNGLLLFFGRTARTLPAALLVLGVPMALFVLVGPLALAPALLVGVPGLVWTAAEMLLWQPVDQAFHLKQRLTARREARAQGKADPEDAAGHPQSGEVARAGAHEALNSAKPQEPEQSDCQHSDHF